MVDSGPAVMTKATSKASTTARARRRCARLGGKVERMKCCSSGTAAAVFVIGATPRRGWSARNQSYSASRLFNDTAGSQSRPFCRSERQVATHDERGCPLPKELHHADA